MLKKIFILIKIARKLALSDALKIFAKVHKPPMAINFFLVFFLFPFLTKTLKIKI